MFIYLFLYYNPIMSYKIPNEKLVLYVANKIIKRLGIINSQTKFLSLVLKELNEGNDEYRLDYKRFRRIILKKKKITVHIHYKETDQNWNMNSKCPVCGSNMRKITNTTLDQTEVTIGYKCTVCPYWTGFKKRVPIRYVFLR